MSADYSPYIVVQAEGSRRVGMLSCLRCGAAILLLTGDHAATTHDEWHDRQDREDAS